MQSQFLDCFVDSSFQGVNKLFVLSFGDNVSKNGSHDTFH